MEDFVVDFDMGIRLGVVRGYLYGFCTEEGAEFLEEFAAVFWSTVMYDYFWYSELAYPLFENGVGLCAGVSLREGNGDDEFGEGTGDNEEPWVFCASHLAYGVYVYSVIEGIKDG